MGKQLINLGVVSLFLHKRNGSKMKFLFACRNSCFAGIAIWKYALILA